VSSLLIASTAAGPGPSVRVTPASAGWTYIWFEVHALGPGQRIELPADALERCVVVLSGTVGVAVAGWGRREIGGRATPFDGLPAAVYLPQATAGQVTGVGEAEVAICKAPGGGEHTPYAIEPEDIAVELRGTATMQRRVHPILMADRPAHSLLVVEVLTPPGHWSSYPPHKHDRADQRTETQLEETYYHRISPPTGFGVQRVYSREGDLDETLTFRDRDVVLVPRGYHAVAMPPGYAGYYLNVMAGPRREWRVVDDPAHAWLRAW